MLPSQPAPEPPNREQMERIMMLAANLENNKQLRRVIRRAKPHLRLDVYRLITPFLKFEPTPYSLLKLK